MFTLTADVEETSIRSEDISLDYDFFHSDLLEISCGGNYTARIIPKDINIWISRLFLGDADGFSILYYQTWIPLSIGRTRRHTAGNCVGCVCGPWARRICGCGNICRNRFNIFIFWESATALRSGRFFIPEFQRRNAP